MLRIQGREVPFLAEHELPNKARQMEELAEEVDQASATGNLPLAPKVPGPSTAGGSSTFGGAGQKLGGPGSSSGAETASTASKFPEASITAVSGMDDPNV